jgi:hypothetical protein
MGPLEVHGHESSPALVTLDDRGRSYLKWPQMKICDRASGFANQMLPHKTSPSVPYSRTASQSERRGSFTFPPYPLRCALLCAG